MLTKERVIEDFKGKIHCSQIVLGEVAEELGYDREDALRIGSPFGGGMFCGETCGAVLGALIAIGMKYGNSERGNKKQDAICIKKVRAFQEKFKERHGSTACKELLGYDFSDPEQVKEAFASGKVFELCPVLVMDAVEILNDVLSDDAE